jgi:hypothetical protein
MGAMNLKPAGSQKPRSWVRTLALAIATTTPFAGELATEVSGIVDVPLYDANRHIGYIPKPNQSGSFLRKNDWAFNELSMGTSKPFNPTDVFDLLLVGDSIVFGGNPYKQSDRLGPQIEQQSAGWTVWPISAGSWGIQNELTYLTDHPEVVAGVDAIAVISNSGDFYGPSSWRSEITHPTYKHFPAFFYAIHRYLFPSVLAPSYRPNMLVPASDWEKQLRSIALSSNKPIFIFFYPDQKEQSDRNLRAIQLDSRLSAVRVAAGDKVKVFQIGDDSGWSNRLYRDEIHPTVEGTTILARIIRQQIERQLLMMPN